MSTRASGSEPSPGETVAVVGMGIAVPGASSPDELWQLLRGDQAVFGEPGDRLNLDTLWSSDPERPDHTYSRVSGFMTGFQPHFPVTPREGEEFTVTWLRHCIGQATADITMNAGDRHLFAVGLTADGSHHLEQSLVADQVRRLAGPDVRLDDVLPLAVEDPESVLPYRIARQAAADLPAGTEITVLDTACSSSLYSIDMGARALRAGEADVALCGGAFALSAQNLVLFAKLHGLSRSGQVRPLDQDADGVLFTDGAAVLALKTHARAVADGDQIFGFIAGFGASSDGRGKAIYAPNPAGQRIALGRAWSAAGVESADIDWVIAHATGTPTGDRTELSALAKAGGQDKTWTVTSNKAVVGHAGWAAGAISVVHALLAMRHGVIPAQPRFTALPAGIDPDVIVVPTADLPWPAGAGRTRTAAVSAMGFGGTNGHLLLTDTPPRAHHAHPLGGEPIVVADWAAHLPGDPAAEQVRDWLSGATPAWPTTFGPGYPLPSPVDMRLAPSAIAAMDRSQLIAVRCADLLTGQWAADRELAGRTGVFVGHSGPTISAVLHDTRCYLAELESTVGRQLPDFGRRVADRVRAAVPAATEDSYPGLMPNIIPARIAQRLDLHGPNMTLDAGLDSFTSALAAAVRSLRDGEIDAALVIGVAAAADHVQPRDGREPAEAALGVVVMPQSIAEARSLPTLAQVEVAHDVLDAPTLSPVPGKRVHHGAEGAATLLRALHGAAGRGVLGFQEDSHTPGVLVTVPGRRNSADSALQLVMQRHALTLRPVPARPVRSSPAALPPGSLVVTDVPDALRTSGLPERCLVVAPGTHDAADMAGLLASAGYDVEHVRIVLTDQSEFDTVLAVNDLAFAAAQACAARLTEGGSFAVLLLGAFHGTLPLPTVGLFTGLVRNLEQELAGGHVFALVTDTTDIAAGLSELAAEYSNHRYLPVAYRRDGVRMELLLDPVAPPATGNLNLPSDPVIVATGGARGLTAKLVRELVAGKRPRAVWLLGTAPAEGSITETALPSPRPEALKVLMARYPGEKIAAVNRRYEAIVREAERTSTIAGLRELCGADRVHYRQCDVTDREAVAAVLGEVLAAEGRVDIVVHGAGVVRITVLARKNLGDYRLVRDVKVRGDHNLRAALAGHEPALWCGISSVGAFIGMRGQADYEAGNEYLMLMAAQQRAAGRDEVALVSGLWVESGMVTGYTGLADFTQLTDEQGEEFFRTELAGRGGPGLAATWVGETEWSTLHRKAPGLRCAAGSRPGAFLAGPGEQGSTGTAWRFDFSIDEHSWLLDHLVDGRPTVPATVLLELAAEAASQLAPGLVPVRMTDVRLTRFLRAPRNRWPRPVVVEAAVAGTAVRVRISAPAADPVPELEYATVTVHLGPDLPPAERVTGVRPAGVQAPDVYQLSGSVQLSGVFSALREARLHDDGGSAVLGLALEEGTLGKFLLPSVTLDSVLRTVVLDGRHPDSIPLVVPSALKSVEFFAAGNDRQLAQRWAEEITLRHWTDPAGGTGTCAAVSPDGTLLLRVTGISTSVRDVYNLRAGRWQTRINSFERN
jgi:3-oxoacyl-(acyl-carrier-protein) synthase/NAD(P)-dependent dehydrogenase (short-subunit alcohol dehydrogenase family)